MNWWNLYDHERYCKATYDIRKYCITKCNRGDEVKFYYSPGFGDVSEEHTQGQFSVL